MTFDISEISKINNTPIVYDKIADILSNYRDIAKEYLIENI